jgi:hypothetical protein
VHLESWVLLFCIAASAWLAAAAGAQNFPERPVTLIVPWSPGGGTDVAMRALAEATGKHLGQRVIVENRPGAAGTIGPAWMSRNGKLDQQENFYMNSEDYARYAKKTFEEENLYVDRMGLKQ